IRGLQHTLKTTDQNFKAVRARLKEFKKATMTDMVTRLSNDIHLQNVLPEMVNRYRNNEDSQIILALIDIEGFGQYNMTYGHELADNLLRTCAKHIVNLGGKYLGWRIGADEFLIATLAKNSEVDHVMSALESLKTRLSKIRLQSKTKATITEPVDIKMIAKPLNLAWGVTDNINHLYIEMRKSQSAEES
nr:diguanylate cyclase [Pseudomonadota bacterium]